MKYDSENAAKQFVISLHLKLLGIKCQSFFYNKCTMKMKNKKCCSVTKPCFQLINDTKGHNSVKDVQITKHQQYAPGRVMSKIQWKFDQVLEKCSRSCAQKKLVTPAAANILQSNNQIFHSKILDKNDKLLEMYKTHR